MKLPFSLVKSVLVSHTLVAITTFFLQMERNSLRKIKLDRDEWVILYNVF